MTGCSTSRHGEWFKKPKTAQEWLDLALEAPTPDERRRGVVGLSQTREGSGEWAMKVYDTVARTDTDPMVRCAAIRAMSPHAGMLQVPTALKLLKSSTAHAADVRPAPGPVRWEAAKMLLGIVRESAYDDPQREEIAQTLLDRLARDDDRSVRLTVIDTLAYFPQSPVPAALVDVIELEDDFTLQHAAETALIAVTGTTHHHDAEAWRQWLAETKNPFEHAGDIPEDSLPRKSKPWW
jgi:HEAT repeat protein